MRRRPRGGMRRQRERVRMIAGEATTGEPAWFKIAPEAIEESWALEYLIAQLLESAGAQVILDPPNDRCAIRAPQENMPLMMSTLMQIVFGAVGRWALTQYEASVASGERPAATSASGPPVVPSVRPRQRPSRDALARLGASDDAAPAPSQEEGERQR